MPAVTANPEPYASPVLVQWLGSQLGATYSTAASTAALAPHHNWSHFDASASMAATSPYPYSPQLPHRSRPPQRQSPQPQSPQPQSPQEQQVPQPPQQVHARPRVAAFASGHPNVRRWRAGEEAGGQGTLAAVVVTIARGQSYDRLFQSVPQQGDNGTRVATYTATGRSLQPILMMMRGGSQRLLPRDQAWNDFRQLFNDIAAVDPASVVFNWECCATCACERFGEANEGAQPREIVFDLMQILLQRGHMVMCSDFSLKALIKEWSERRLGPNPFVNVGQFGGTMKVRFDPHQLSECPSAQLQKVGQLSEDGSAEVSAMPSTIVYGVDMRKADTSVYSLQVLTVVTEMSGFSVDSLPAHLVCNIGEQRGTAGHVLLTYPSGGKLLVSAGHWVELSHIGVSEDRLLQVAASSYGQEYAAAVQSSLRSCADRAAREQTIQTMAAQYVQQSTPCTYSSR